jgi:hypothetical protein
MSAIAIHLTNNFLGRFLPSSHHVAPVNACQYPDVDKIYQTPGLLLHGSPNKKTSYGPFPRCHPSKPEPTTYVMCVVYTQRLHDDENSTLKYAQIAKNKTDAEISHRKSI